MRGLGFRRRAGQAWAVVVVGLLQLLPTCGEEFQMVRESRQEVARWPRQLQEVAPLPRRALKVQRGVVTGSMEVLVAWVRGLPGLAVRNWSRTFRFDYLFHSSHKTCFFLLLFLID